MIKQNPEELMKKTMFFYEEYAEEYIKNTNKMEDTDWLIKFSKSIVPNSRVLDIGCAGGRDCKWFKNNGFEVYGVDFSHKMIINAKKEVLGVNFYVMDILNLQFPAEYYEGIWCSCV